MKIFVNIPKGFRDDSFITEAVKERLESVGEIGYNSEKAPLGGEKLKQALKGYDVVITGWGQPLIKKDDLDTVKLIVHTGGTVGGIVDMEIFDSDITVLSGNSHYAQSVAEGVIAYMLYALRKMGKYGAEIKNGGWTWDAHTEGLLDQSVGLVSLGAISTRLIPMLKLFTDDIRVYSTHCDEEIAKNMGFRYASLDEIFSECKVVSVHTAKNDETYHMINKKHFDLLCEGSLFINTSRGPVIDEKALIETLKTKNITALLDVYDKEPLPQDSELIGLENVILFPHMAGPTYDRREKITLKLIDDIVRFEKGEDLLNVVDKETAIKMTVA